MFFYGLQILRVKGINPCEVVFRTEKNDYRILSGPDGYSVFKMNLQGHFELWVRRATPEVVVQLLPNRAACGFNWTWDSFVALFEGFRMGQTWKDD